MFAFTEFVQTCQDKLVDATMDVITNVEEHLTSNAEEVSENDLKGLEKAVAQARAEAIAADQAAEALIRDPSAGSLAVKHAWAVYHAKQKKCEHLIQKCNQVKRAHTLLAKVVDEDWTELLDKADNDVWLPDGFGKYRAFAREDLPRAIDSHAAH